MDVNFASARRIVRVLALVAALLFAGLASAQADTANQPITLAEVDRLPTMSRQPADFVPVQNNAGQKASNAQPSIVRGTGNISGTILDQTGAVSVGAHVRFTSQAEKQPQETVTGDNGQFSFSHVPAGSFQITVNAPGFASQVFSGELRTGQTFLVPAIVLPVATAETQVQVGVSQVQVAEAQIKEQEKQRVLAFIPNFYASYVPDAAPLTPGQKFRLAWKVAHDPTTFFGVALLAGFQQAGNDIPGYGQGTQGYAKRFGAAYADTFAGIFIGDAILPSLLKQDPRYFYKGKGTTKSRLLYALSSSVICKGDNKRWQPNYSGILGGLAVGGVSNLYYPASDRNGFGLVLQNTLIRLGEGSLGAVLQEFLVRKLTPHVWHRQP